MPTLSVAVEPVLRRARDGVCIIGSDGRIVFWNRVAERILGYSARDVVGRSCCDVFLRSERSVDTVEATDAGPLSRRELEILRLVASGLETRAIADRLRLSPATVRDHVQNVLGKLEAHNWPEAVARATRRRLP